MNKISIKSFLNRVPKKAYIIVAGLSALLMISICWIKKWFSKGSIKRLKELLFGIPKLSPKTGLGNIKYYIYPPSTDLHIDQILNYEMLSRIEGISDDFIAKTKEGIILMKQGIKYGLQAYKIRKEAIDKSPDPDIVDADDIIKPLYSDAINEILDGSAQPEGVIKMRNCVSNALETVSCDVDEKARADGELRLMKMSICSLVKACQSFKNSGYFNSQKVNECMTIEEAFQIISHLISHQFRANYITPLINVILLYNDNHDQFILMCERHLEKTIK